MATTLLPSTGAVSGLGETLAFFTQADFAQRRFAAHGDVFETKLLAQRMVFIRGEQAIADLMEQGEALEGWWPDSVRKLLGGRRCSRADSASGAGYLQGCAVRSPWISSSWSWCWSPI